MSRLDPQLSVYFGEANRTLPALPPNASATTRRIQAWALSALDRIPIPPSVTIHDIELTLPAGHARARFFHGHDGRDEPIPTIIYFHGGGWVIGDVETYTVSCAQLAREANALVVSIDYPLAPEHSWQTITQRCYEAAVAVVYDCKQTMRGAPIALAGDSAGGHLATITALRVLENSTFRVALQALIYPCIEPNYDTESFEKFGAEYGPSVADMAWHWAQYANADLFAMDYRIAPSRAASHRGLPLSYIATAGCDSLRDDGRAYVNTLRENDVEVIHDEFSSMPHGFLRMAKHSISAAAAITQMYKRIGELLRRPQT